MSWSLYAAEACRLYVAFTLLAAVAGKARALPAFRDTVSSLFHLPARWTTPVALAVIVAEAAAAAGLLVGGGVAWGGMALALALFIAFAGVILATLIQRKVVACNCFGGDSHPISAWDLVRNALLGAAAATYLAAPASGGLAWSVYPLIAGVALGACFATIRLARLAPSPASDPFTLPIGQPAPAFAARRRSNGELVSSPKAHGAAPQVLAFLSPECPKCLATVPQLEAMLPSMRQVGVEFWLISAAVRGDLAASLPGSPLLQHLLDMDPATRLALNPLTASPFYIFLDTDHVVLASDLIGDPDWLSFAEQMADVRLEAVS